MLTALLLVSLQAAPNPRLLYESKCLYCHSEEVTEKRRFTEPGWRKVIAQMRARAPLLITTADARVLTRFIVQTLKLVPPAAPIAPTPHRPDERPRVEPPPEPEPPSLAELKPLALPEVPVPPADDSPEARAQAAARETLELEGAALMQRRCSKCHSLGRVFTKLDSYDRAAFTLKRMRLKTGSGISENDARLLEQFLRVQFE